MLVITRGYGGREREIRRCDGRCLRGFHLIVLATGVPRIWENEASNLTSGRRKIVIGTENLCVCHETSWCPSRMYCFFLGDSSGFQNWTVSFIHLQLSKSHALYSSSSSTTLSDCDTCRNRKPTEIGPSFRNISDMGVSKNSVPLNPMVNDHYPY